MYPKTLTVTLLVNTKAVPFLWVYPGSRRQIRLSTSTSKRTHKVTPARWCLNQPITRGLAAIVFSCILSLLTVVLCCVVCLLSWSSLSTVPVVVVVLWRQCDVIPCVIQCTYTSPPHPETLEYTSTRGQWWGDVVTHAMYYGIASRRCKVDWSLVTHRVSGHQSEMVMIDWWLREVQTDLL